jgi:hypothetical protein
MGGRLGNKVAGGGIGERIFAEVEQLTADGRMKRLAAFTEIATKTGGQVGTISANYYRIARKRGVTLQSRQRGGRRVGSSKRAIAATLAAVKKLAAVLAAQDRELAALRKDNRRFAELRRLLKS